MVGAPVSGSRGPGSSPDRGHGVVFLGKTFYSHSASLSTQVYKWGPANQDPLGELNAGGNPVMD